MNLSNFANNVLKTLKSNSPEILTALGVSGVLTTAYLSGKASVKATRIIDEAEKLGGTADTTKQRLKERTKLVWKCYIPTGVSGALTIGCIIGASKKSNARTAAAVTAYSLTEKAFSEYKEKVAEQLTASKRQKIQDDIAQDRIDKTPPSKEVVMLGIGEVLCCELRTMRYFHSDMEALRRAQNDVNNWINTIGHVSLTDFYAMIDLQPTAESDYNGWDGDDLMELSFSHGLAPDGRPCLTFDYNYVRPL
jgi:hypothetical protein